MDRQLLNDFQNFLVNSRMMKEGYDPEKVINWFESHLQIQEEKKETFIKARVAEGKSLQNLWDITKRDNPDYFVEGVDVNEN